MKPELQFAHRSTISLHPGIISRNPKLQFLKSHPQSRHCGGLSPLDVMCHGTSQHYLSLEVGQNPNLVMNPVSISFNVSILKASKIIL